jgi:hypothetical protein
VREMREAEEECVEHTPKCEMIGGEGSTLARKEGGPTNSIK